MNVLTHWSIKTSKRYIYCTGRLLNGKEWETSPVTNMVQLEDRYVIYTENSIYHLYW